MSDSKMFIEDYSEKAIVVRGDTKPHKDDLKKIGGMYNGRLRGGPGWIFSKQLETNVMDYIINGTISTPNWSKLKKGRSPQSGRDTQESRGNRGVSPVRSKRSRSKSNLMEDMTSCEGLSVPDIKALTKSITTLNKDMEILFSRLNNVETKVNKLMSIEIEVETDEEEEEEQPMKRLLK